MVIVDDMDTRALFKMAHEQVMSFFDGKTFGTYDKFIEWYEKAMQRTIQAYLKILGMDKSEGDTKNG